MHHHHPAGGAETPAPGRQYSLSCPGRRYSPHRSSAPGPWGPLAPGPRLPCSPNVQPYPPSPPTQPTTGPHTTGPHTTGSMLLQTPGKISIPSLPGHHGQSLTSRVSIPAAFPTYHHQAVHCQPASLLGQPKRPFNPRDRSFHPFNPRDRSTQKTPPPGSWPHIIGIRDSENDHMCI